MKKTVLFLLLLMGVAVKAQVAYPAPSLFVCDDDNDGYTEFDLTVNNIQILGGQNPADFTVTYYETAAEAQVDVGAIDTNVLYVNIIVNTQTIYARVTEIATGNYDTTSFNLVVDSINFNPPVGLNVSDDDNDGFGYFDLSVASAQITGGNVNLQVTFHHTLVAAQQGLGAIDASVLYQNLDANGDSLGGGIQVLYLNITDISSGCSSIGEVITLNVSNARLSSNQIEHTLSENLGNLNQNLVKNEGVTGSLTSIESAIPVANYTSIHVCDDNDVNGSVSSDGFFTFNLIDYIPNITGGATGVDVTFYTNQADAENGSGSSFINDPTAYINTVNPQAIFSRVTDNSTGSYSVGILEMIVSPNPTPLSTQDIAANLGNGGVMEACDGNVDGTGAIAEQQAVFNVTQWETQILTGSGPNIEMGVSVAYYISLNDAEAGINTIAVPTSYTNTANPQTIYVRVTNDGTGLNPVSNGSGCYTIVEFQLYVPVPEVTITGGTTLVIDENGNPISDVLLTAIAGPWNPAVYDYQWALNGVDIPLATGMTYVVTQGGAYTVTVSGPTDFDCINIATHVIDVVTIPQDNLTVETISETCVGLDNGMVQITANEVYTYEVSMSLNGNAIAVSPNTFTDVISIPNLASGTYYVCVTATEVNVTQCYDVYVEAVEDLVGFSGRIGNVYSLELTGSKHYNVAIDGVVTEINVATTTEVITLEHELSTEITSVKVTTDKECQGRFEETVLLDTDKLVIYPNPAVDEIRFSTNAELSSVMVYDVSGKVVLQKTNNTNAINVSELAVGLYFIKATSGTTVFTSKFIKK